MRCRPREEMQIQMGQDVTIQHSTRRATTSTRTGDIPRRARAPVHQPAPHARESADDKRGLRSVITFVEVNAAVATGEYQRISSTTWAGSGRVVLHERLAVQASRVRQMLSTRSRMVHAGSCAAVRRGARETAGIHRRTTRDEIQEDMCRPSGPTPMGTCREKRAAFRSADDSRGARLRAPPADANWSGW